MRRDAENRSGPPLGRHRSANEIAQASGRLNRVSVWWALVTVETPASAGRRCARRLGTGSGMDQGVGEVGFAHLGGGGGDKDFRHPVTVDHVVVAEVDAGA